jgi:hypothetical protein
MALAPELQRFFVVQDIRSGLPKGTFQEREAVNTLKTNYSTGFDNHGAKTGVAEVSLSEERVRRLTEVECERLQGFPDGHTEGVSGTQRYRQMGNAVPPPMIEAVADLDEVWGHFKASIAKPKARDLQVKVGPSLIGTDCYFCLGYEAARKYFALPARSASFGYAAWLGTMAHEWLENHLELPTQTLREHRVEVFDVAGYGTIKGSCDLVTPEWRRIFDYKFPGEYSYEKLRLAKAKDPEHWRPSNQYRYQQQLYAHGLNEAGVPIEVCTILFFPRHLNDLDSVIRFEEPYSPEMVYLAKARLEAIIEDVLEGRLGDLPSAPDCFECDSWRGSGRPDVTGYLGRAINHEERQGATT